MKKNIKKELTEEDIKVLAELKEKFTPKPIMIERSVIEDICKYCEDMAIYDKLGNYGDFYYKLKKELNK